MSGLNETRECWATSKTPFSGGRGIGWALYLESKYHFKYVVRVDGEERGIDAVDAMSEDANDNKYVS